MQESLKERLCHEVVLGIQKKKGINIVIIDLCNLNDIADSFIICTGTNDRQIQAIANSIRDTVYQNCEIQPSHIEGSEGKSWVILDYFDVIVHIFLPQTRLFYDIETLWGDGVIKQI